MKPCTEVRKCSIRVNEEYIFYEILQHVDYMHRARAFSLKPVRMFDSPSLDRVVKVCTKE